MPDTDTQTGALQHLKDDPATRKRFLRMVGGAGATGALGLLAAACGGKDSNAGRAATTTTAAKAGGQNADVSIVNYALTLEYVEADFYD